MTSDVLLSSLLVLHNRIRLDEGQANTYFYFYTCTTFQSNINPAFDVKIVGKSRWQLGRNPGRQWCRRKAANQVITMIPYNINTGYTQTGCRTTQWVWAFCQSVCVCVCVCVWQWLMVWLIQAISNSSRLASLSSRETYLPDSCPPTHTHTRTHTHTHTHTHTIHHLSCRRARSSKYSAFLSPLSTGTLPRFLSTMLHCLRSHQLHSTSIILSVSLCSLPKSLNCTKSKTSLTSLPLASSALHFLAHGI